ncbi:MAG: Multi-copper polyphenol oxidoreductase, laccase [Parcubacteria group bacterium GW2011_GWA2_42_11]|nr:MAG: Multi-copper polyphenol oxidoreductase, laccase [Parcubacteria group bacterium GW2011_GWA2_42_11]
MRFKIFAKHPELKYGFSEKADGNMKLNGEPEFDKIIYHNREVYFKKEGVSDKIYWPKINHTSAVEVVGENGVSEGLNEYDALIADKPNVFLAATAADCFLLYFYDPIKKAIGLAHAGWRGILGGITKNTISALRENFGSLPENILLGISPGIQVDHFFVREDAIKQFEEYNKYISKKGPSYYINLPRIIIEQAMAKSVKLGNIESSGECTFRDRDKYFSFRRDKPERLETMVGYIGKNE